MSNLLPADAFPLTQPLPQGLGPDQAGASFSMHAVDAAMPGTHLTIGQAGFRLIDPVIEFTGPEEGAVPTL